MQMKFLLGAPDLRGILKTISATRGGGTIPDSRADGTEENGVHDVSAFDFKTPIHVVATYEDNSFVLRPVGIPGIE